MAKRPPGAKSSASEPAKSDVETAETVETADRIKLARPRDDEETEQLIHRHLAFGWWSITVFTALGLLLEAGHGLKLGWYLDVSNATRRLSFTLGHAHGTLLGVLNLAFAFSLRHAKLSGVAAARASFALRAVTVLLPLGFLLGGIVFYAGDPGFAIVLVPPSGALLVIALAMVAHGFSSRR